MMSPHNILYLCLSMYAYFHKKVLSNYNLGYPIKVDSHSWPTKNVILGLEFKRPNASFSGRLHK